MIESIIMIVEIMMVIIGKEFLVCLCKGIDFLIGELRVIGICEGMVIVKLWLCGNIEIDVDK